MSTILAIDPGNEESAYVVIDHATRHPTDFGKVPNEQLLDNLDSLDFETADQLIGHVAIEMVASFGMPVGREVFETCVWIGRYQQAFYTHGDPGFPVDLVTRKPVKMHHCGSNAAKDSNIAQALKDRFAHGVSNHGKGTKAAPGWFYGFKADVWQAYALAVYVADTTRVSPVSSPVAPLVAAGEDHTSDPRAVGEAAGGPTPQPEGAVLF